MRFELSRSAATAGLIAAVTTRLFYGMTLDIRDAANAAWIAPWIGLLLSLPALWLLSRAHLPASRSLCGLLFAAIALDAAGAVEWTAYSESCLAFDHTSPVLLMLPLLLAVARCAWLGGDAVGGAARIWIRLFSLLMLVVLLYQLPYYRTGWLRPWLGAGAGGILRAGVRAAGWNVLLYASTASICKDELTFRHVVPGLLLSTATAALLIALRRMMAPLGTDHADTRAMAIDALLTNGRAPLYLQLPMIVAWFSGMLHLMAFESLAACGLIRRLLPRAKEGVCAAIGLGAVFVLSLMRASRTPLADRCGAWQYYVLVAATVIIWLVKGRGQGCATSV